MQVRGSAPAISEIEARNLGGWRIPEPEARVTAYPQSAARPNRRRRSFLQGQLRETARGSSLEVGESQGQQGASVLRTFSYFRFAPLSRVECLHAVAPHVSVRWHHLILSQSRNP